MNSYTYRILCIIFSWIQCSIVYAETQQNDWKFYGGTAIDKEVLYAFFSSNSVEKMPNGHVRVWMKSLADKDIQNKIDAKEGNDALIEGSAKKVAAHYIPPYYTIQGFTREELVNLILQEEIANHSNLNPRAKIFYELDCTGKKIRNLSVHITDKHGNVGFSKKEGKWEYIPPESSSNTLMSLLCKNQSH